MNTHVHSTDGLTKNQTLVFGVLSEADGPLSAYKILDQLRDHGFRAPLQVYRALDALIDQGIVHRLESLNAFVACAHPECGTHEFAAFAICSECGQVTEVADAKLTRQLVALANARSFELQKSTVELRGVCAACR